MKLSDSPVATDGATSSVVPRFFVQQRNSSMVSVFVPAEPKMLVQNLVVFVFEVYLTKQLHNASTQRTSTNHDALYVGKELEETEAGEPTDFDVLFGR